VCVEGFRVVLKSRSTFNRPLTRNSVSAFNLRRNCVFALDLHSFAVSLQSLWRNYPRRRHLSQDSRLLNWSDESCAQALS
jgi:hypothetical protein